MWQSNKLIPGKLSNIRVSRSYFHSLPVSNYDLAPSTPPYESSRTQLSFCLWFCSSLYLGCNEVIFLLKWTYLAVSNLKKNKKSGEQRERAKRLKGLAALPEDLGAISQHPHGSLRHHVTPVPGIWCPLLTSVGTCMPVVDIDTQSDTHTRHKVKISKSFKQQWQREVGSESCYLMERKPTTCKSSVC